MASNGSNEGPTQSLPVLTTDTIVSHFKIIRKIGVGGMGEVFLAEDTRLNRKVALKFLDVNLCSDEDYCRRFALEAKTAASLDHPNILTVHEVGEFRGRPFFSMQFLDGESLRNILSKRELSFKEALDIVIQICDGLRLAHSKDIVHRDLKPANIIILSDGLVKVLDFGLAKVLGDNGHTQAGTLMGTINYMSPEQVNAHSVDFRSDIFSVGVLFYEMLTGVNPFARESMPATINAIAAEEPPELFIYRHTIAPECQSILNRALAKKADDRYPSISHLLTDLKSIRAQYSAITSDFPSRLYGTSAFNMASRPSIAVLPFINMSPDPNNEYFADGLSEELLNVLTKIGHFRVAARTSSFVFKNKRKDIRAIGKELNVSAILEGSVRKYDNRVRITVQLVKVADGYHFWSQQYDRTLDDIFVVQDDIARSVLQELRVALLGEEPNSSTAYRTEADVALAVRGRGRNPEAHRMYLLGQYHVERLTQADATKALEYFRRATELDSSYAAAWAGLSRAYSDQAGHGWMQVAEGFDKARASAMQALEIEPGLAEGHMRLGLICMSHDWDWNCALDFIQRALELAPGKASILRTAAHLASNLNRLDEAISLMRQVVVLDPLSSAAYHSLGIYCYSADRLDEAAKALETALELNSGQIGLWFDYARVNLAQGLKEKALLNAKNEVFEPFRLLGLTIVYHAFGNVKDSDSAISELVNKYSEDGAYQIAEAYAFRDEADHAFEWLEKAYRQRDPGLPEMRTEPMLRRLHLDPRWRILMEEIGFAE